MKSIVSIAIFLFFASCVLSSSVVVLDSTNLASKIESSEFILVKFYAPWCGHCKTLAPEYVEAAKELGERGSNAVLAEIDCDANQEACVAYGVKGYPTLIWFSNGKDSQYGGGRKKNEIVSWVERYSSDKLNQVTSEDLTKLVQRDGTYGALVLFGNDATLSQALISLFRTLEDVSVAQASGDLVANAPAGTVRLYKKDGTSIDAAEGADLATFVSDNAYPAVVEFSQAHFQRLIASKNALIFGITPFADAAKKAELISILESAAASETSVGYAYGDSGVFTRGFTGAGASGKFLPTFVAIGGEKQIIWDENTPVTAESLKKWIGEVLAGTAETYKKSEDIPTEVTPVTKIVWKNYNSIVNESGKPVLVKYYAPWCGHCKTLAPIYENLASFANKDRVIIADIDATANYSPEAVQGFPTLIFFDGKGGKETYNGNRSFEDLKEFVEARVPGAFSASAIHDHSHDEL